MKLLCTVLLAACMLGCGYGSNYNPNNPGGGGGTGAPVISQLQPNTATAGGADFVLTVNGSNFGTGSVIYWNATARMTTYVTNKQLTTMVSAVDIATAGSVPVYVRSGSQNSANVTFTIN